MLLWCQLTINASVCFCIANYLKDTLMLLRVVCKTLQLHYSWHALYGFKTRNRKEEAGVQWIRRHLPSWLVRFGSLTGVWHMLALFGGSVPALFKKVLSAGECGVKPRGFGLRIFLSPLCLFHQHMCSVKPWPSWCCREYLPPAWCGLTSVRCGYWSGAAEVIPPGTRPHHNTHITNVGVCECTQPVV